jgi:hypothetical protein
MTQQAKTPGQALFEVYAAAMDGISGATGKPIPPWAELGDRVQSAWEVAAERKANLAASLTQRERAECEFAATYALNYGHGTDGHLSRILIAKLYWLLTVGEVQPIAQPTR